MASTSTTSPCTRQTLIRSKRSDKINALALTFQCYRNISKQEDARMIGTLTVNEQPPTSIIATSSVVNLSDRPIGQGRSQYAARSKPSD
jgi:hypothetical protein